MRRFLSLGLDLEPGQKLLGRPWVKIRLGLVGAAVLILGSLLAPRAAQPVLSVPDERAVPLLEERVVQRDREPGFGGVQSTVREAARYSVAIPAATDLRPSLMPDFAAPASPLARPAGFGVVVSAAGHVLTHETALNGLLRTRVQTAGGAFEDAEVTAYETSTGYALLRIAGEAGLPVPESAPRVEPGALVVAVGRFDGRVIAQPAFVSSVGPDAYTISTADEPLLPGTPVFDLEGRLLAVSTDADRPGRAFPAGEAIARLTARAEAGQGHEPSIGVVFQVLDQPLARAFGTQGALVSQVIEGGPAHLAGLEPGDVLVAVNRLPVDSSDSALRALASLTIGSEASLQVVRGRRPEESAVIPASAFEVSARARAVTPTDTSPFLEAGTLWPFERLRDAGIPPAARVLLINGHAVTTRAQALREIARQGSTILYVWHNDEPFFAVIEGPS